MVEIMKCIFCESNNEAKSVEHIVPESLGNKHYILEKGKICEKCNTNFSKFENVALTKSILLMERSRYGNKTKKGHNAKGKIEDIIIEGDKSYSKNIVTIEGLNNNNFKDYNPKNHVGTLEVSSFDKSEVQVSKLILKIGFESIFKSRKDLYKQYDFKDLKDYLLMKNRNDWPFLVTDFEISKYISVAKYTDKHRLKYIHCELKYLEIDENTLLFKFKYGSIPFTINLINRNLDWIIEVSKSENAFINPEHFNKKLSKKLELNVLRLNP